MWSLRILSGAQMGQIFSLNEGSQKLGRGSTCALQVLSNGVSKEHCEFLVQQGALQVNDLNSSNGTFVNGVRVRSSKLKSGDKLMIHDIICDVQQTMAPNYMAVSAAHAYAPMNSAANPAESGQPIGGAAGGTPVILHQEGGLLNRLWLQFMDYIETVALPGVYRLAEIVELRLVLLGMFGMFIVAITLLAMIPMVNITQSSILLESQRRAQSLAVTLADIARSSWAQSGPGPISTTRIETEEGVKQVFVVHQMDGTIISPTSRAGATPDLAFVHKIRREKRMMSEKIDSSTIAAGAPIDFYDPATGEHAVKAHAIVLYDVAGLSLTDGKVVSLFMQTLLIACVLGLILFFFFYRLVERPIVVLNEQLDLALRENRESTEISFQFPVMQNLIGNLNSLLTRYHQLQMQAGSSHGGGGGFVMSNIEGLLQIVGYPAMAVDSYEKIISANQSFLQMINFSIHELQGQSLGVISEVSLQQKVRMLLQLAKQDSKQMQSDSLEIGEHSFRLVCQSFSGGSSAAGVFLIAILPAEGESNGF